MHCLRRIVIRSLLDLIEITKNFYWLSPENRWTFHLYFYGWRKTPNTQYTICHCDCDSFWHPTPSHHKTLIRHRNNNEKIFRYDWPHSFRPSFIFLPTNPSPSISLLPVIMKWFLFLAHTHFGKTTYLWQFPVAHTMSKSTMRAPIDKKREQSAHDYRVIGA